MLAALTIKLCSMFKVPHDPSKAKIQAIIRKKLFTNKLTCPQCQRRYTGKIGDRYWCKNCRLKFSLKTTTIFKGSKLPWTTLWKLLSCWLTPLSISQGSWVCQVSEVTTRRWYRKFAASLPHEHPVLQGVVEVDEAFIGKQRYGNQKIVVGALERSTGRVVLRIVPNREMGTLDRFLLDHITPTSMVYTDAWPGYEHITEFFGFGHESTNHSLGHFGITNRIENTWMRFRSFIRKTVARAWKEHLPRLMREFQARNNHKEAFSSPINFLAFVFQVG